MLLGLLFSPLPLLSSLAFLSLLFNEDPGQSGDSGLRVLDEQENRREGYDVEGIGPGKKPGSQATKDLTWVLRALSGCC